MKNKLFKWISKKLLANDPILWAFTEAYVQSEAESEIDRELTEEELGNFVEVFFVDEEIEYKRMELVREAILKAVAGEDTWV